MHGGPYLIRWTEHSRTGGQNGAWHAADARESSAIFVGPGKLIWTRKTFTFLASK
jgi:hypothetical protein